MILYFWVYLGEVKEEDGNKDEMRGLYLIKEGGDDIDEENSSKTNTERGEAQ